MQLPSLSSWPPLRGGVLGSIGPAADGKPPYDAAQLAASSTQRGGNQRNGRRRPLDNDGIIPVLARAVREVENAVERRSAMPGVRTKFQVVALLAREERIRVKGDTELTEAQRNEQLKRLDGIATILAKTAARDSTLFTLLAEDAVISDAAKELRREMVAAAGLEAEVEEVPEVDETAAATTDRAPGRPAVGHLAPARQPVPGARLLGRRAASR